MCSINFFDNVDKVSRSVLSLQKVFDCPICLDMLDDPVRTTVCGHTFCRKCINQVLKGDFQKKPCPLCNATLSHRSVTGDDKTLKFLQLSLELITAINLDTGLDVTEYRRNCQSTNEASESSEEFFKVKKIKVTPNKEKFNYIQNKTEAPEKNDIKNFNKSKNTVCDKIKKSKLHHEPKAQVKITECFLKNNNNITNELNTNKDGVFEFKKPLSKDTKIVKEKKKNYQNKIGVDLLDEKQNLVLCNYNNDDFVKNSDCKDDNDSRTVTATKDSCPVSTNNLTVENNINDSVIEELYDDVGFSNLNGIHVDDESTSDALAIKSKSDDDCVSDRVDNIKDQAVDHTKETSINRNVFDINCENIETRICGSVKNYFNVPFMLIGGVSNLKEFKECETRNKKEERLSVPFVLFGTLELDNKKRKFDEILRDNYNLTIDDIKRITLLNNLPNSAANENLSSRMGRDVRRDNAVLENCYSQIYPQARKRFHSLVPEESKLMSVNSNDSTERMRQKTFIPSQSSITEFDIFDNNYERDMAGGIIDDDNFDDDNFDDHYPDLDELPSISQITSRKNLNYNVNDSSNNFWKRFNLNRSPSGDDNSNDACSTVINENIFLNKNKIKLCTRKPVDVCSQGSNNFLEIGLSNKCKIISAPEENQGNVSVSVIENSEPFNGGNCLINDWVSNKLNGSLKESLSTINCKGDVTVNEIENSEPLNHDTNDISGLSGKIKQHGGCSNLHLCEDKIQNNVRLENSASQQVDSVPNDFNPEEHDKANNTIIDASDDELEDSISQTPPTKSSNKSGEHLGMLLSQVINTQQKKLCKVPITESETNEIPSSLNDTSCSKPFKSNLMSNANNAIPSMDVSVVDTHLSKPVSVLGVTEESIVAADCGNKNEKSEPSCNISMDESRQSNNESVHVRNDINNVSIINKSIKNMSFVYSRLTDQQLKELKKFAFQFNADITNNIIEGMTTHVVIHPVENNRAPHTFKYLKGVACKLWIVSTDWISDSLKCGKLLPEKDYLVMDSSGEPGPLRCKQPDCEPLLKHFIFIPFPPFIGTTVEQVKDLIVLCGGDIVSLSLLSNFNYKAGVPRIILIQDSEANNDVIEFWLEKYHLICLTVEWLLETVGQYKLAPLNSYMAAPYPEELLRNLGVPDEIIGDDDFEDTSVAE